MALRRPPLKAADVHRAVGKITAAQDWPMVSYPIVRRIFADLNRGLRRRHTYGDDPSSKYGLRRR